MPFGELFYIFISDYNESHPQNIIEITNSNQRTLPMDILILKHHGSKGTNSLIPI